MSARELAAVGLLTLCAAGAGCTTEVSPSGSTASAPAAATAAPAADAASDELQGTVYGEGVKLTETTPISAIWADPDAYEGKTVRVEGQVTAVCKKRGCWLEMESDAEFQTIKLKVDDGVIVFPQSARGQHAVAEGVVRKSVLDLEQTRAVLAHQAEEQGEELDPESVTEPMTMVRLDGVGAVIRDAR